MGVFNYKGETTSLIPLARLFKAFILGGNNLIPKVAPQAVRCVEKIEGNGGPGTIKKITFPEGSHFEYVKARVDEIDHANFKYNYSVIEGGSVADILERICYEIKIVASPDGGLGSILKITNKYHLKWSRDFFGRLRATYWLTLMHKTKACDVRHPSMSCGFHVVFNFV
ncbi:hypothetical protein SLA2020_417310 [Shorea laevis]